MNDLFSKIENFLFDILGLVLPGVIFLLIIISPVSFFDSNKIQDQTLSNSFVLSAMVTILKMLKTYWASNLNITLLVLIIIAYLIGHSIKVFSIIIYEFFTAIFDKSLNRLVIFLFRQCIRFYAYVNSWFTKTPYQNTYLYKQIKILFTPIKNTIAKIFTFNSDNYFNDNEQLKSDCVSLINQRLNTTFPNVWYSVYKLSTVMQQQENIKALSGFFLVKYNLYRSLSFIFIFTTIYYYCFFKAAAAYISPELTKISPIILFSSTILWFTFHYKYKRYWTLCGNETLVSLYYFLNKTKINEA